MKIKVKNKVPVVALRIVHNLGYPNVTKIVDAKESITISVTPKDGRLKTAKDHRQCAMAAACKRQQHADGVIISVKSAYVIKGDTAYRYQVPISTSREVVSFDRSGGFSPGEYQICAPSKTNRLGHYWGGKNSTNPSSRTSIRHVTQNVRTSLLSA